MGSNSGLLLINSDGTIDFSANGAFDHLGSDDATAITEFSYGIDCGAVGPLEVPVSYDNGDFSGDIEL